MEAYRLHRDKNAGAYMEPAPDGKWYERSDADARITALETALAAMTAERDSLKDAVHFLNTMNDEQDEWFTRIADDHGGWHEDLPTGEAHIEEIIGNLKKERDARDVAIGVLAAEVHDYDCICRSRNIKAGGDNISTIGDDVMNNPIARAAVEGER